MSGRSQPATLVWMRDRRERGTRPALTEERIVRAAIDLADAEGIDALSMRRIASEMGSGTTSLYRHITNKDELIELMVDVVFGEIEPPAATADWLAELADVARGFRGALLRHPWLAQQATRRPALGPNVIRSTDHALGVVGRATDDASQAAMIVGSINTFVLGSVAAELAELEAQRSTGMTEADWRNSVGDYVQQVVDSGRYPHFNRRILEANDRDYEARFEFGLGCLLGGVAAALT